jgi:hypothetical protein
MSRESLLQEYKVLSPRENPHYWLCYAAEERLAHSIKKGRTIVVENNLLLKFEGRLAALCLEDFTTSDGSVFKKGFWYSLIGKKERNWFKEQYRKGITRIDQIEEEIDWVEVREFDELLYRYTDDFIEWCKQYADSISGEKLSRKERRQRYKDTYAENY